MTNDPQPVYTVGQYVELYPTVPSSRGVSIESGTRGIVRDTDLTRPNDDVYLVEFLSSERVTGETAWLHAGDLFPA
jgi:DNA-binding transcriptional regulator YdaS (Cro superfamily)